MNNGPYVPRSAPGAAPTARAGLAYGIGAAVDSRTATQRSVHAAAERSVERSPAFTISLSGRAPEGAAPGAEPAPDSKPESTGPQEEGPEPGRPTGPGGEALTDQEVQRVEKLEARDKEVKAHELAHKVAAGPYGGPIHYDYETGPDAKRYAVGGHVPVDMSEVPGDPEATARKMQVIRRAALAPAEPSGKDRQVAAEASRREAEAQREAAREQSEASAESGGDRKRDAARPNTFRVEQFRTYARRRYQGDERSAALIGGGGGSARSLGARPGLR